MRLQIHTMKLSDYPDPPAPGCNVCSDTAKFFSIEVTDYYPRLPVGHGSFRCREHEMGFSIEIDRNGHFKDPLMMAHIFRKKWGPAAIKAYVDAWCLYDESATGSLHPGCMPAHVRVKLAGAP